MKYTLDNSETERLQFRLLTEDDFDHWLPFFDASEVMRFFALDPSKPKEELCQLWFDKVMARYANDLGGMNVLIDKKTGAFVGQCGLLVQTVEDKEILEIGYSVLPEFWGKGYATEAARHCKEMAFSRNYTDAVHSIIHVDNHASEAVALKNGMTLFKAIPTYLSGEFNLYRVEK
jgi:ribosomal-protein-alanine N-acetyltransferase